MGSCDACGYLLLGLILCPAILHGCGLFGTEWVTVMSCKALNDKPACCNVSSIHSTCYGPVGLRNLDQVVYAMQWIEFAVMFIPTSCILFDLCCLSKDGSYEVSGCVYLGGFCFLFYPIAGLLSCIGCVIVGVKYSGQSFGVSFRLCLASGICNLIIASILTYCMYSTGECREETVVQREEINEAATQNEDVSYVAQSTTIEETSVVHD